MNKSQSMNTTAIVVTCATGLEHLLIEEIQALGAADCIKQNGAVACTASLETAYKICLWSRVGSRVLWQVKEAPVSSVDELYEQALNIPWNQFFSADKSFRIHLDITKNDSVNSQFAGFRLKDAIRDYFQNKEAKRLVATKDNADVFVNVFWNGDSAQFSVDLAGAPLHQRGYRVAQGQAPLKETLAAAMLLWADWHKHNFEALIDPFCGSGTLLIEAALIKLGRAPGLLRKSFALTKYCFFQQALWQSIKTDAESTQQKSEASLPLIRGFDADAEAVKAANANIEQAGLKGQIHVERSELGQLKITKSLQEKSSGLIITNAPYGERIGEEDSVRYLYTAFGRILQPLLPNWQVGVLSNQAEYINRVGIEDSQSHRFSNGPIRCYFRAAPWANKSYPTIGTPLVVSDSELPEEVKAFANRLKKNLKPLRKWAQREGVSCYRIYDADMPEFNVAIDWYDGELHVQEYKPPKTVDEKKAKQRLDWVLLGLVKVFDIPKSAIRVKTRSKQKGKQQYRKLKQEKQFRAINENGAWLLINLQDYLDTGVFLDHRPVRHWIQNEAAGKRFLNLFSYTGTATVHAAIGGAKSTVSVDMSKTYQSWARSNLLLNGFAEERHRLVQANCVQWLKQSKDQFDLIFMDPPTFSNSKRMQGVLDTQRDHVVLIDTAMKRLEPGGKLLFSNNFRKFSLADEIVERYQVKDVTQASIPEDFKRSKAIHCCFEILHR